VCKQVQPKGKVPVNESDEVLPAIQTDDAWSSQDVQMVIAGGLEKLLFPAAESGIAGIFFAKTGGWVPCGESGINY